MPTFVISASVYVDEVTDPAAATQTIDRLNDFIADHCHDSVHIVLPDRHDPGSSRWEMSGDDDTAA